MSLAVSDPEPRWLQLPSGKAAFTDVGQGPVVVAVHGYPGTPRDYRYLGALLEPHCRLIRVAMPGQELTPLETGPQLDLEGSGRFIREMLDALTVDEVVLVGHSLGAGLATMGVDHRVRALALLAPIGLRPHQGYRRWKPWWWARAARRELLWRALQPITRAAFRNAGFRHSSMAAIRNGTLLAAAVDFSTLGAAYRDLHCPTLLAWAEDDVLIEPAIYEELAAVLPEGPRLRWPTGGHNIQKSHAEELAAAILSL